MVRVYSSALEYSILMVTIGVSREILGHRQPQDKKLVAANYPILQKVQMPRPKNVGCSEGKLIGFQTFISLDGLSVMVLGLAKISALFFYRRIFCSTGRRDIFNYITAIFIALVAIWAVVFVVITYNLCEGHSVNWRR